MECLNNISVKQFTFSRLHLHIINSCLVFKIELRQWHPAHRTSPSQARIVKPPALSLRKLTWQVILYVYIFFFQYIIYIIAIFSSSIFHTSIKNRCAICRLSSVKLKSPKGRDWLWSNLPIAGSEQNPTAQAMKHQCTFHLQHFTCKDRFW